MDKAIVSQWQVASSTPGKSYVVSLQANGQYQCGCIGWTRHYPREDCKHILVVLGGGGTPLDPMIVAMNKVLKRAERRGKVAA